MPRLLERTRFAAPAFLPICTPPVPSAETCDLRRPRLPLFGESALPTALLALLLVRFGESARCPRRCGLPMRPGEFEPRLRGELLRAEPFADVEVVFDPVELPLLSCGGSGMAAAFNALVLCCGRGAFSPSPIGRAEEDDECTAAPSVLGFCCAFASASASSTTEAFKVKLKSKEEN